MMSANSPNLRGNAGYEFWLFPNLLSDQVDIVGAFKPLHSFEKPKDGQSHIGTRIGGLVGTVLMVYMMYVYSPDEKTIARNLAQANDSILDMFHSTAKQSIGDGTGYQPPKFGSERTMDVGSIRQHMMNEKIRKRQEKKKAKKDGVEESKPPGAPEPAVNATVDGAEKGSEAGGEAEQPDKETTEGPTGKSSPGSSETSGSSDTASSEHTEL
jgi:hypothetical protein